MIVQEFRLWAREILAPLVELSSPEQLTTQTLAREVDLLLMASLDWDLSTLHRELTTTIAESTIDQLRSSVERRLRGEPLAYIIGKWWFYSLELIITPAVLIPRPETELIVERALSFFAQPPGRAVVIDVGTGSGAILLAILDELRGQFGAAYIKSGHYFGVDISKNALVVAHSNAKKLELEREVSFIEADLLADLAKFDAIDLELVVANLPYVSDSEVLPRSVDEFEPRAALRGGADGLEIIRRLVGQLSLRRHNKLAALLEIGAGQDLEVESELRRNGFEDIEFFKDLRGVKRVVEVRG